MNFLSSFALLSAAKAGARGAKATPAATSGTTRRLHMAADRGAGGIIFSPDAQAAKSRTASNLEPMATSGEQSPRGTLNTCKFDGEEGTEHRSSLLVLECPGTKHTAYTHTHDLSVLGARRTAPWLYPLALLLGSTPC